LKYLLHLEDGGSRLHKTLQSIFLTTRRHTSVDGSTEKRFVSVKLQSLALIHKASHCRERLGEKYGDETSFPCGLFDDALSSSHYLVTNVRNCRL